MFNAKIGGNYGGIMYKDIFINLSLNYPDFYNIYENFYLERFIYSSTEIEGIKTKEERKIFVNTLMRAFHETYNYETSGMLDVTMIKNIGNLINHEKGLEGFRKINVYPGDNATFIPAQPFQIYPYLYSLLDNYYNVWNDLDPFLKESMFHINFMRIHPFEDGNKRCAKIILASNLLKSFCAPIIITEEDTKEYYEFINNCDYEGFAEFLRQRSKLEMDTLVSLFKMKYNVPMEETPDIFNEKIRKIKI